MNEPKKNYPSVTPIRRERNLGARSWEGDVKKQNNNKKKQHTTKNK